MQACGPPPAGCTSPTCALPNAPPHTRSQQPHTEHPRRSRSRLGRAPHCTRRADRARSHGSALQPTYRPPRELSGPDSGRRRRGRSSGGTRGSWKRLVSRARPTKGRLTCGRAQGSNCPFRPERFNDLESHAPCGDDRSRQPVSRLRRHRDKISRRSAPVAATHDRRPWAFTGQGEGGVNFCARVCQR